MTDRFSQFVSYVFHPLLMPSMMYVQIYFFLPEIIRPLNLSTLPVIFMVTFVFPIINLFVLKKSGWVSSFRLEDRNERIMPFVFVAIFFGMASYLFIEINTIVSVIFISTTALIIILTIITVWYKVSVHAAGLCGIVGFLMSLSNHYPDSQIFDVMTVMIVISGLVMSARLQLNAHTPREVLLGALVGFLVCFNALYWLG